MKPLTFARCMAYASLLAWTVFFWQMRLAGTTQILIQTNQCGEHHVELALLTLASAILVYRAARSVR